MTRYLTEAEYQKAMAIDEALQPVHLTQPQLNQVEKRFLVENLIEEKSLTVFYGPAKTGKTLLLVDLVVHLVSQNNWVNEKICEPAIVTYLAYEDSDAIKLRMLQSRLQHFPEHKKHEELLITGQPPDIYCDAFIFWLDMIAELDAESEKAYRDDDLIPPNKPRVLVIDTLAQSMGLIGDENSSSVMGRVIDRMRLIRSYGWTVLIVTHSGKDRSKGIRGHSSFEAAIDNAFHVNLNKASSELTVTQTHYRNGPLGKKLKFKIEAAAFLLTDGIEHQVPYLSRTSFASPEICIKLSNSERIVLSVLEELMETDAVNIGKYFGTNNDQKAVDINAIASRCYEAGISSKGASTASSRRATKRALDNLVEKGLINEKNSFFWLRQISETETD